MAQFVIGSLPVAWWAGCVVSAIRAFRFLGYWPSYGQPDPKDLPQTFWSNGEPIEIGVSILIVALLGVVPVLILMRRAKPLLWIPMGLAGLVLLWTIGFVLLSADPWGVVEWIVD